MNRNIDKILADHHKKHEQKMNDASFCIIVEGSFPSNPTKRKQEILHDWYVKPYEGASE